MQNDSVCPVFVTVLGYTLVTLTQIQEAFIYALIHTPTKLSSSAKKDQVLWIFSLFFFFLVKSSIADKWHQVKLH